MGNETDFVVKKRCTWLTVLKAMLVLAAIAFAAYKIYEKIQKKKAAELDAQEPDSIEPEADTCCTEEAEAAPKTDEAAFEVSAQDVIVNSESMSE